MVFLAPIWLLTLLPWGVVTLWLLWGRRQKEPVPFLPLWHGPGSERRARQSVRPPPVALAAMLFAIFLALLAAARPVTRAAGTPITIIVDRGITMSAAPGGEPRFVSLARSLHQPLLDRFGSGPVRIVDIVGGATAESERGRWVAEVAALPRTALDTAPRIEAVVRDRLAGDAGPLIVITDQPLLIQDARVASFAPASALKNVAIVDVAARDSPVPQVMVRVRNDSPLVSAELRVSCGEEHVSRQIDLPAFGQETNHFIDVKKLGDIVDAQLIAADDLEIDNRAALVREGDWPRVEAGSALSDELRRMLEVYGRSRRPREDAATVAVVNRREELGAEAGVVVESPTTPAAGDLRVVDDPVTAVVRWPAAIPGASSSAAPDGWTPLVSVGGRTLVAKRELPARQVWVGFDSPTWSRSADYVVFWTNVFEWVGGGGERYVSHPLSEWNGEWKPMEGGSGHDAAWPGIYQRGTVRRAFRVAKVKIDPTGSEANGIERLPVGSGGHREIASWVLLVALGGIVVSAATWRRGAVIRSAAEIVGAKA